MNKYAELKAEYEGFLEYVLAHVPAVSWEAVSAYISAAALKIWGSNLLYSPDYAASLSEINGERYTIEQVVTAMACCGDPERKLLVPELFTLLVQQDLRSGSHEAETFIRKMNDLLVGIGMINGDFTVEEASCLSSIIGDLVERAAAEGVNVSAVPDNDLRITKKSGDGYLRNDELFKAAKDRKAPATMEPDQPSAGEPVDPVTINIKLISVDGTKDGAADSKKAEPEKTAEAPAVTKPDADQETMESLLAELDALVGLDNVKQDVHSLMNFIKVTKIREKRGMKVPTVSYHLVFTGNPGTGKTTVARLVAKLYYHMGILPQGQLVETDRSALVAGYLGQTAIKTQKVIQQAMGGVLFIDEAYSLAGDTDDSYGKEAIETILKAMEDHRDELVVIVAGYTELMHKFMESNPGLSSRFSKYFEYPDYSGAELLEIFQRFCGKNGYVLEPEAAGILRIKFDELYEKRDEHFGNARTARNIFEKAINAQADRIAAQSIFSDADLENIISADILAAIGGGAE